MLVFFWTFWSLLRVYFWVTLKETKILYLLIIGSALVLSFLSYFWITWQSFFVEFTQNNNLYLIYLYLWICSLSLTILWLFVLIWKIVKRKEHFKMIRDKKYQDKVMWDNLNSIGITTMFYMFSIPQFIFLVGFYALADFLTRNNFWVHKLFEDFILNYISILTLLVLTILVINLFFFIRSFFLPLPTDYIENIDEKNEKEI